METAATFPDLSVDLFVIDARGGALVHLRPVGEIDLATVGKFAAAVDAAFGVASLSRLVVDLDRVSFLDASAITTLVHARRTARQRGVRLRVVNAHGVVRKVLHISGVAGHLLDSC